MPSEIIFERVASTKEELPAAEFVKCISSAMATRRSGVSVGLRGELGAGKTTFVKEVLKLLGISESTVVSPTYTLQQRYEGSLGGEKLFVEHWDVYRLASAPYELLEALPPNTLQLVEWAEKVGFEPDYRVDLEFLALGADPGGERKVTFTALSR
jgi:tRNA threonylcarbamoyladenosine biosynthesis protein TsaE